MTTRTVATGTATLDIRTDGSMPETPTATWLAITVDDPSGQPVQQARRTVQVATEPGCP